MYRTLTCTSVCDIKICEMQDKVHLRHILHCYFSMANGLRQYVMWMNAVNTSNTLVYEMQFCRKNG